MKKKVNIFTLGCSKNRVDSEVLMKQLSENGFEVYHESPDVKANYILINTCGFIGDAKEESIETILNFVQAKEEGLVEKVMVFGCLSERYKTEMEKEIPEVNAWFGKFELPKMLEYIHAEHFKSINPSRILTTPSHYAYLKVSEGCNRTCSYCAIPKITGRHVSRSMESLVEEAQSLVKMGVKEVILIAQDLSDYGIDLYKKPMLAPLMEQLAQIPGLKWLRIHYAYPARFPVDILPVMAKYPNICNYLDIALQHISNPMLKAMRRNVTKEEIYELLHTIREHVPGIALRTTLMVGHPGETETDFEELKSFVKEMQFERLGVFTYSHEENTYAWDNYSDEIPEELKQERADTIMEIQQGIALSQNLQKEGKTLKVIIDRREGEYYIGRTEFDSPEVDNEVLIRSSKKMLIGDFYEVTVQDADEYDLYAVPR